jgi:peptide/nickel transport system permease protein
MGDGAAEQLDDVVERARRGLGARGFLRILLGDTVSAICAFVIVFWVVAAVIGPLVSPYDVYSLHLTDRLESPSRHHWLGTDEFGRDVLVRLFDGARISLGVGLATVVVSLVIGTTVGAVAGFSRRLSSVLMRLVDTFLAFPGLLFAIFLAAVLGQGFWSLLIALTAAFSPLFARVAFGEVRALKDLDYVHAATVMGCSKLRILRKHLLPQMSSSLIVQASYVLATAVIFEASLSFIGAGVPAPKPSWGSMVATGKGYMTNAPWLLWPVAIALTSLVLSTSLLGDRLRDMLDPRHQRGIADG